MLTWKGLSTHFTDQMNESLQSAKVQDSEIPLFFKDEGVQKKDAEGKKISMWMWHCLGSVYVQILDSSELRLWIHPKALPQMNNYLWVNPKGFVRIYKEKETNVTSLLTDRAIFERKFSEFFTKFKRSDEAPIELDFSRIRNPELLIKFYKRGDSKTLPVKIYDYVLENFFSGSSKFLHLDNDDLQVDKVRIMEKLHFL